MSPAFWLVVDDGILIDDESIDAAAIREDDEYGGVSVTMMGYLGKVRIPVQFDVGIGDFVCRSPGQIDAVECVLAQESP